MDKLINNRFYNDYYKNNLEYDYNKNSYSKYFNGIYSFENFDCKPITKDELQQDIKYFENDYYNTYIGPFKYFKYSPYKF